MKDALGPVRAQRGCDLGSRLRALEGAPYPAYRDLRGRYGLEPGGLEILHVQPDPFAPPSRLRVRVPLEATGLVSVGYCSERTLATEDFLARAIERWLHAHRDVGAVVRIDPSVQQILRRTAVRLRPTEVELLLSADLPARGRRIEGRRAAIALAEGLPRMVRETILRGSWDAAALARHCACVEDHAALTGILGERGWVAFIADGTRLARRSGEDDTPLAEGNVPFVAPPELAAEVVLPNAGRIRGTAVPAGITLLCGGGFHGKSTLLRALAVAVYPHIPGDGRERIATEPTAMAIRAEDGRAITHVDLGVFIGALPNGKDVNAFGTNNASGSTSQAASILEALAVGCRCLLIDEDTSATNFLLRDPWVARLLRPEQEPIIPLLSRVREIHEHFGASVILVVGGSGEAFRVADRVIVMDSYRPQDASARVEEIRAAMGPGIVPPPASWATHSRDLPLRMLAARGPRVRALGAKRLLVGRSEIDLSASGALVHPSQARALATILTDSLERRLERACLPEIALDAAARLEAEGPGVFSPAPRGDLAEVRVQEIAMLFDRLRWPSERAEDSGTQGESRESDGLGVAGEHGTGTGFSG